MRFYNREKELALLAAARQRSEHSGQLTLLTGRRRVGKTRLIREHLRDETYLYFFITRKNEPLLCAEFVQQVEETLGVRVYGQVTQLKDLFAFLLDYARTRHLNLVVDEFQELIRIAPSIFGDFQNLWDSARESVRLHWIVSGSVYSLMSRLFEDAKEPLFGRANERLFVRPFRVDTQRSILTDYAPNHRPEDFFCFYLLTGGVPKYIEYFVERACFTRSTMLDSVLRADSLFLDEGRNVLIEEFGRDHATYFSVLSLIAAGKTTRQAIESVLQRDSGGYLAKLESDYRVIERVRPVNAKPGSRSVRYALSDNFLTFWFRFLYKYRSTLEIQNFDYLRRIVERDYRSFGGRILEKLFRQRLAESGEYAQVGSYWEAKNQNEIDVVAIDPLGKRLLIGEVKWQAKAISLKMLEAKATRLVKPYKGYQVTYVGYSLADL